MSILYLRDKNGNFVPMRTIKGSDGKSAYEQAVEGGYKGSEESFIALLNGLTAEADADHYADFNNPHKTTASQVGALALTGGTLTGKTLYFDNGNARLSGGQDYMQMDVFDSAKDDNNRRKLVLNGNNTALKNSVILTAVEGGVQNTYTIYGGHNKPTASDVGAVAKKGDTMTGSLTIDKDSAWGQLILHTPSGHYRCFETDDDRVRIDVRDEQLTTKRRYIDIFTNEGDSRHSHALRFAQTKDGSTTQAYILHTENINNFVVSRGSYAGTGTTSKTIPIRKTTQAVIVYGMQVNAPYTLGILVRGLNAAHCDIGPSVSNNTTCDVAWSDTEVTVSNVLSQPIYAWNVNGVNYHYVVIG